MEALRAEGITKKYPGVTANANVSLTLEKAEIHTLVGENGAGKSTLCKILYGETKPDAGIIKVFGKEVSLRSPYDALELGIGMVHQHFRLIPSFTVTENIILGAKMPTAIPGVSILNFEIFDRKIVEISERFGLKVDPKARVGHLSSGEKQRVELLKALYRDVKILILDEPTSVLTSSEVSALFSTLKRMVEKGLSIIFTTHKLEEAIKVSSRITVLRDGRVIAEKAVQETNPHELANLMIGRDVSFEVTKQKKVQGPEVLKVESISVTDAKRFRILKDLSIQLREGEILGVAGVAGNGQRELAEAITGCRQVDSGKILMKMSKDGKFTDVTNHSAKQMIAAGVAHITDEPLRTGIVADFTIAENLALKDIDEFSRPPIGILSQKQMTATANEAIQEFSIKARGPSQVSSDLSGGNIQRLVVARELSLKSLKVLVASNPTKGVDIALTEFIRNKLMGLRERGTAILLISEDLDEILAVSDRIVVIFNGKLMGSIANENPDVNMIGLMMTGLAGGENEKGSELHR
jgi:general nucleoside transport system ATP-binding protein